jgi:hypothetical protein
MKAPRGQKSTTVSVGDGPPRIVPVDKEDEYISGLLMTLTPHHPISYRHLVTIHIILFCFDLRSTYTTLLYFSILYFTLHHFSSSGMGFNMGEDCCEKVGCDWASPFESTTTAQKV